MTEALTDTAEWQALAAHARDLAGRRIDALFAAEPERFRRLSLSVDDLLIDASRHRWTAETRERLVALARRRGLPEWIEGLFTGEAVNVSEGRPALHPALRERPPGHGAGEEAAELIRGELRRMEDLVEGLRRGDVCGYDGRPITDVVNLGIGGSQRGAALACTALGRSPGAPAVHFAATADGRELAALLHRLEPGTTLFIVSSKSFTTLETLANARTAWAWLERHAGARTAGQFLAVSADAARMAEFGIPEGQRFRMHPGVGGRYSLASAIGLPVAIGAGMDRFYELLAGLNAMDRHYREAPLGVNAPVLLGLLTVWSTAFEGVHGHCLLPYDPRLAGLPGYLQQLEMESCGKRVDREGRTLDYPTGPIVWGDVGSHAQHTFMQWLHQGTGRVTVDFLAAVDDSDCPEPHRGLSLAQVVGQAQALMRGVEDAGGHQHLPGDRASTVILFRSLDPYNLGRLVALYEHKVYTQAVVWGINPFDQWGVELGKRLAGELLPVVRGETQAEQVDRGCAELLAAARELARPGSR